MHEAQEKGGKVVVVNPVRTPLANQADLFIQLNPGTDAALALGVMNILIQEELYDKDFVDNYTHGFDELVKEAAKYPVDIVTEITGEAKFKTLSPIKEFAFFSFLNSFGKDAVI